MPEKLIVDWTDEFDRWLAHAEEQGGRLLTTATAVRRGSGPFALPARRRYPDVSCRGTWPLQMRPDL